MEQNAIEYFDSYADTNVHMTMLNDEVRMETYFNAIMSNLDRFENKTVLEVGTGTGIISMWIAKYTKAKHIYAVEANKDISELAQKLVEHNELDDRITIINALIEECNKSMFNNEEVDIIISEWMGHYLLHESMLESIIFARDNFLRTNGIILPHKCVLYASLCYLSTEDYFGLNKSLLANINYEKFFTHSSNILDERCEPAICQITSVDDVSFSTVAKIFELDLYKISYYDLISLTSICQLQILKSNAQNIVNGLCIWFDCYFSTSQENYDITLTTAPGKKKTHWKQFILKFDDAQRCIPNLQLSFSIVFSKDNQNERSYNISFEIIEVTI